MSQKETIENVIKKVESHIPALEQERRRLNSQSGCLQIYRFISLMTLFVVLIMGVKLLVLPLFFLFATLEAKLFFDKTQGRDYFKDRFKGKIISAIIKEFNPDLNYRPKGYINQTDFHQSKIFKRQRCIYEGEDFISGKLGSTDFRLSELRIKEESIGDDEDENEDKIIFEGLFLVADFHKYFHSETYVLPETKWKSVGLHKRKHEWADLVIMENERFEKEFRVFTTSEQDARYILSPSMMERILKMQYKYGNNISISFRGSNIYIAFNTSKDFFEHNMNQPVSEQSLIHGHLKDLKKMLATIDELNLNTRIWSKMPKKVKRDRL